LHRLALALADKHGGRAVAAARMHMTLVFLGQTPRALEPALLALLRTLPPAGPLRLERLGAFGPRLLWAGPSATPEWLEALSERARAGLDALGAGFDRKAFRPHVTMLRSARQGLVPGESVPAIDFGPSELLLVDSQTERPGGHYRWISP
ncbi:MAG TPA: 2'-5' RNA ligase family protein, partial [Quisquiliibacterium sp.]|nr:2'-5' RNA ligase family protein [Quisquiliibacterium sp.]